MGALPSIETRGSISFGLPARGSCIAGSGSATGPAYCARVAQLLICMPRGGPQGRPQGRQTSAPSSVRRAGSGAGATVSCRASLAAAAAWTGGSAAVGEATDPGSPVLGRQ